MRNMPMLCVILMLAIVGVPGCDDAGSGSSKTLTADQASYGPVADREALPASSPTDSGQDGSGGPALPTTLHTADRARHIIFNADLDLVVDDFTGTPARVADLALAHGGFVAESEVHGAAGEPRSGRWTLRIPASSFDQLLSDAESLGQVRRTRSSSEEVTAEFVDLQSRLRNKIAQEQRLAQHLESSTGDLEDILRVERELSRVRGEAEVLQGRLNVLTDLTAMSTVTVRVEEIRDYVPAPTEEPGFAAQAGRAWSGSVSALVGAGRAIALAAVTVAPWLVVVLPTAGVVMWGARRVWARVRAHAVAASAPPR